MSIGIFADPLMGKGGGSKVIIDLANYLKADIITSGFNKKLLDKLDKDIYVVDIGNTLMKINYSLGYLFEAPLRFMYYRKRPYDINIFIGTFSIFASRNDEKNIWLSLTPNRIMYDLRDWKLQSGSLSQKAVYKLHTALFQNKDQEVVRSNFIRIVTQNKIVQDRIKKYYKKYSTIINSSIPTEKYKFNSFGDYFLTVSRLLPEKRIDLIAQVFKQLPEKRLIIVGDGPQKSVIKDIIKESSNISLFDKLNDRELNALYANCLATIYMPLNEDFGLVPIEGMASGKACIAANEGGCLETVIHGKTGFLIEPNIASVKYAVLEFNREIAEKMKNSCIAWAKKFDTKYCMRLWKEELETLGY